MKTYGLTKYQIQKAKDKVLFNKEYMSSNGIQLNDKFIPFADFVANSYVNADRYIAELQHRAWSIYEYANDRDLSNVFFTLTLPSKWHKKRTINKKLVSNPKFGGRKYLSNNYTVLNGKKYKFLNCDIYFDCAHGTFEPVLDFSKTIDYYTPRNASKELSKMLVKFLKDRAYSKNIEKADRCYFRVTEPHKDGTPHLHVSLFVPADKLDSIVKSLNRLYPAPLGKIETSVKNPVSYLMKYVLKTLDDLREDNSDITNLTLWYLYHGISRFYTSRTFVSLEVYRKLNGMYTLRELTTAYHNQNVSIQIDAETKKIAFIEDEHGVIYSPKPVNWFEKIIQSDYDDSDLNTFEPLSQPKEAKPIDIIIDGEEFIYFKGNVSKFKKKPYQMTDFELYNYFNSLDIDTCDDKHYIYTRNLLIKRGYIDDNLMNLSALDELQNEFESEVF